MTKLPYFLRPAPWIVVVTCLIGFAGCSGEEGPAKFNVSGTVTYQGKPVPAGVVIFEPDAEAGNTGPQAQVPIKDGKFDSGPDSGVISGAMIVKVRGTTGIPNEEAALPDGEPLFEEHTLKLELPEKDSTHKIDVPGEG